LHGVSVAGLLDHCLRSGAMIRENQHLVTDEPVESEKNSQLKFKTSRELPITLEEFIECTSN
jgi:hypothetical protein